MATFADIALRWTEDRALTNSTVKPPPLPEPQVVLPKEILAGARQLKPEEIGPAVLKEVAEAKKAPKAADYGYITDAWRYMTLDPGLGYSIGGITAGGTAGGIR